MPKSPTNKKKELKDTPMNRLRAIESIATIWGEEPNMAIHGGYHKQMTRKRLETLLETTSRALTDCYRLAHGAVSDCCKGLDEDQLEPAMRMYYEKETDKLLFK